MNGYEFKVVVQTPLELTRDQKWGLMAGLLRRLSAHCTPEEWKLEVLSVASPDTYKCYCGKPVDMTNSDCVEFGLCEDHADDA